jgi:hypothetical protein
MGSIAGNTMLLAVVQRFIDHGRCFHAEAMGQGTETQRQNPREERGSGMATTSDAGHWNSHGRGEASRHSLSGGVLPAQESCISLGEE